MLDQDVLKILLRQTYLPDARDIFGENGPDLVNKLIDRIREFFIHLPPDQITTKFIFFAAWVELPDPVIPDNATILQSQVKKEDLQIHRLAIREASTLIVVVRHDGFYDLLLIEEILELSLLSKDTIIFVNHERVDQFMIDGKERTLEPLIPGAPSNFATPMVMDIDQALTKYGAQASKASCIILADAWEGGKDGPRLVFSNRPEASMRNSLERFLNANLKDVSVRVEHNTDATKPVDIYVRWFGLKFSALIEIKWVGKSLSKYSDGNDFTEFSNARVQEGADQLADYMDREISSEPTSDLRGYLVVFDGRRRGVKHATNPITAAQATYYRSRNFNLSRDYSLERDDYAPVVRYFLEPRASLFLAPEQKKTDSV